MLAPHGSFPDHLRCGLPVAGRGVASVFTSDLVLDLVCIACHVRLGFDSRVDVSRGLERPRELGNRRGRWLIKVALFLEAIGKKMLFPPPPPPPKAGAHVGYYKGQDERSLERTSAALPASSRVNSDRL